MKKFTLLFIAILFLLFVSLPAYAGGCNVGGCKILSHNHHNNIDVVVKDNIIGDNNTVNNSTNDSHDKTLIVKDNLTGIQNGNKNTAINGDSNTVSNDDNSILKNADLTGSQNGLANQKGIGNQQGLLNQKGSGVNQAGLLNQNGDGNQMGLVNLKGGSQMGLVNVKGSGNQGGIQIGANNNAVNGDNNGVIVQQVNSNGGNQYPNGLVSAEEEMENGIGGGGGGGNNIVNAMVDNSVYNHLETRELLPSKELVFGPLGNYTGEYSSNGAFQPIENIIMLKKDFSYEGALETYGKPYGKGMCETRGHSYNGRHEDDPSKSITVYQKTYPKNVKVIGYLTAFATKKGKGKITSFMVLQKIVLSAALQQGHAVIVTGQGFATMPKNSGWGIGWNTSGSLLNEMGNRARGASASGGTGYSNGSAELWTLPYITVQVVQYTAE